MRDKAMRTTVAILCAVLVGPVLASCTSPDESSDGNATSVAASSRMATDFPLADGELTQVDDLGAAGWSTTVKVADATAQQAALDALVADGYVIHGTNDADPKQRTYALNNEIDAVTLTLTNTDGQFLVSYSVAPIAH